MTPEMWTVVKIFGGAVFTVLISVLGFILGWMWMRVSKATDAYKMYGNDHQKLETTAAAVEALKIDIVRIEGKQEAIKDQYYSLTSAMGEVKKSVDALHARLDQFLLKRGGHSGKSGTNETSE